MASIGTGAHHSRASTSEKTSMRAIAATLLGLACGILFSIAMVLLVAPTGRGSTPPGVTLGSLVLSTAVAIWFMLRGAGRFSTVIARGALLGAACWILIAAVGVLFTGRSMTAGSAGESEAAAAGRVAFGTTWSCRCHCGRRRPRTPPVRSTRRPEGGSPARGIRPEARDSL